MQDIDFYERVSHENDLPMNPEHADFHISDMNLHDVIDAENRGLRTENP